MNRLLAAAATAFASGDLDWPTQAFSVVLVDEGYVFDPTDENLDDIAGGRRIGDAAVTGRTVVGGVLDAADTVVTGADPDRLLRGLFLYRHTGTEATSLLVAFFDINEAGAPIRLATTGEALTLTWSNGPLHILKI